MTYPTIGDYNNLIHQKGGKAFKTLNEINLIPSKINPIKIFLFGSGANAAVFKGLIGKNKYAIRCFLNAEEATEKRYRTICEYLKKINSSWKTKCEFIEDEILVNNRLYPILKMEWVDGLLINEFVTNHLHDNKILNKLQIKLFEISNDLEKNKIGHGDIQSGNIIIENSDSDFKIKLIDYDGMYVPGLADKKGIEKGRSEFQHPQREEYHFCPEIDRFSFWVMITALEAIKFEKSLWMQIMQGGYNTLDNFLFTKPDFVHPSKSELFHKLSRINSPSLNFYLDYLNKICKQSIFSAIPAPKLYKDNSSSINLSNFIIEKKVVSQQNTYRITTNNGVCAVLTSTLKKIGDTPLELDKNIYFGKIILISNGKKTKQVLLNSQQLIEITFDI